MTFGERAAHSRSGKCCSTGPLNSPPVCRDQEIPSSSDTTDRGKAVAKRPLRKRLKIEAVAGNSAVCDASLLNTTSAGRQSQCGYLLDCVSNGFRFRSTGDVSAGASDSECFDSVNRLEG